MSAFDFRDACEAGDKDKVMGLIKQVNKNPLNIIYLATRGYAPGASRVTGGEGRGSQTPHFLFSFKKRQTTFFFGGGRVKKFFL